MSKSNQSHIYDRNFLMKTSKKIDILQRLGELHIGLSSLSQEPSERPKHLTAIAAELISAKFLGSSDKELRLLSCACVVDILRVFAPDAPYSDAELCTIFRAITRELKGLGTCNMDSPQGMTLFYILQSLSIVKSCVVLVYMVGQHADGAVDVLVDFFDVLVSNVRQDHSEEVTGHIGAILQGCIEESEEDLCSNALCILLSGLLPSTRKDNPASYRLCQSVLRRVATCIQISVTTIINKILVGASADIDEIEGYDFGENIHTLIYELHKISSGLLLRILPNICTQLQAEEIDIRLRAIKLLGSLFSSPLADYGVEFSRNFRDFLGRFVDVSSIIREEMLELGSAIMKSKPCLRVQVEDCLRKRLRDSEPEIRHAVLLRLTEVATEEPTALTPDTFAEMAERMKDRRPTIRRTSMLCLARLYARHVSGRFTDFASVMTCSGSTQTALHQYFGSCSDVWTLLKPVPGYIISCWGYPEFVDKQLVMQLLQEYIIPRYEYNNCSNVSPNLVRPGSPSVADSYEVMPDVNECSSGRLEASEGTRASALIAMWVSLDAAGRSGLASILGFKTKVRKALAEFLKTRSSTNGGLLLRKSMLHLLSILAPQDKKQFSSDTLNSSKDNTVYRLLSQALESPATADIRRSAFHSNCASRDDLRSRVGTKTPLGEYMSCLFETAAFMVASRDTVQNLLQAGCIAMLRDSRKTAPGGGLFLSLITILSKYCPQSFEGSSAHVQNWLSHSIQGSNDARRRSLSQSSRFQLADKDSTLLLLTITKLSSAYIWREQLVDQASGRKTVPKTLRTDGAVEESSALCEALLGWCKTCSDSKACYALSEAACSLIMAGNAASDNFSLSSQSSSHRWQAYVPKAICELIPILSLSSHDGLLLNDLSCDLHTLAPLCNIGGSESVLVESKITEFIVSHYLSAVPLVGSCSDPGTIKELGPEEVSVLEGAIRVWTSCSVVVESVQKKLSSVDSSSSSAEMIKKTTSAIINIMLSCLEKHGSEFGDVKIRQSALREKLREACACSLMEIIKVKSIGRVFNVSQWHALAWTLIDSCGECRRKSLSALSLVIQTNNVHPRFLALPCLVADDDENSALAQQALEFAIKRLRLSHDIICSKVMVLEDQENEEEAVRMRRVAEGNLPECILPYVIHLLSCHPDFPISKSLLGEGDSKRVHNIASSLRMVINALLSTGGGEVRNKLSYMLKQVEILGTYYCDRLNPDTFGLGFVANLARDVLNEKSRALENLQPYPGEITLPMDLFCRRLTTTSPVALAPKVLSNLKSVSQNGDCVTSESVGQTVCDVNRRKRKLEKGINTVELTENVKNPKRSSSRIRDKPPVIVMYEDNLSSCDSFESPLQLTGRQRTSRKSIRTAVNILLPTNENELNIKFDKPSANEKVKTGKVSVAEVSPGTKVAGATGNRRSIRGSTSGKNESIQKYFKTLPL